MHSRLPATLIAALALCALTVPAFSQDTPPTPAKTRQTRPKPAPSQQPDHEADNTVKEDEVAPQPDPSQPAAPGSPAGQTPRPAATPPAPKGSPPAVVVPGPYIEREKPRDWTLTVNVTVRPDRSDPRNIGLKNRLPEMSEFSFETLSMVFPLPAESASALPDLGKLTGKLTLNDRLAINSKGNPVGPDILDKQLSGELYHSGTRLMRFAMDAPTTCREIGMEFAIDYHCWNTVFKENEASQVDWPAGEVPDLTRATLAPQLFVDYERTRGDGGPITTEYDRKAVVKLVESYTGGNVRTAKPIVAAKFIAGKIATEFQTSGSGLRFLNTGELQGFELQGVPATIQARRGTEFDVTSVLVAAFRAAELPARLMIGWDLGEEDRHADDFLRGGPPRNAKLRCWVELGLYDEPGRTMTWIPVDVVRMRKSSSRTGPIDKPWRYFGTHDELQRVVPIAFGFHPPTTVESYGAPGLWGWLMTPQPPDTAYQSIRFRASSTSKTAQDMPGKKDQNKKKDKNGKY